MTTPARIAIVSMAGCFPGAPDVDALWHTVLSRRCAAREVTRADWPVPPADVLASGSAPGVDEAAGSRACLLDEIPFDPSGLDLPPALVPRLGRLARLTLHVGAHAFRPVARSARRERTRVILANIALPTDDASRLAESLFLGPIDRRFSAGPRARMPDPLDAFPSAIPAGLLARALGLGGGSFTLDAACASSLYAVYLACAELEAGRADAVLCGGVSLPQAIYTQIGFSQLMALSKRGRPAPYDEGADGLVVGEGAAMFVLKRAEDAVRDGDEVLAVVRGVGLSNDVGGSLLSPESEGQLRAMRAAYQQAGWSPDDVDLIEGHGTGTPRGDAVELGSVAELWRGLPARGCVLGSVKSNIGHLLTAAGAAGLAKVLCAMRTGTLPPSANVDRPCAALREGPMRVLAAPIPWARRAEGVPRRAAVSAFGFGGINAHVLLEEPLSLAQPSPRLQPVRPSGAVAVVGMAVHVGGLDALPAFERAAIGGHHEDAPLPPERWHGLDRADAGEDVRRLRGLRGAWIGDLRLPAGRFKIPPSDVPSVLPQQLLMLEVTAGALDDAGGLRKGPHLRTGVVVGIGLDLESTSFHLRWLVPERVRAWQSGPGMASSQHDTDAWIEGVKGALAPPLDATRTQGALGGIVPSRVAREFHLGGPSFAVSDDQAGGLRALEVAVRILQRGEADAMVVGAVDLAGDVRSVVAADGLRPFSPTSQARPFDAEADGAKVAEGAVALVLKRLEDALAAGDRIYATVRGVGAAGGGALEAGDAREDAYVRAGAAAQDDARISLERAGLVEAHGSGVPAEDAVEARAWARLLAGCEAGSGAIALASAAGGLGQAGAASSLVSVARAVLCLSRHVLPASPRVSRPTPGVDWASTPLHIPRAPEAWVRNRSEGARVAVAASMAFGGSCVVAVLEEHDAGRPVEVGARPVCLGSPRPGLFLLRGEDGGAADAQRLDELLASATDVEQLAGQWHALGREGRQKERPVARALVASSPDDLRSRLGRPGPSLVPIGGELAVVFPGSGNHFVGMGRELALAMPEVCEALDAEVEHLAGHLQPRWVAPRRWSWEDGWEEDALRTLDANPERVIVAAVASGILVHDAVRRLGVRPAAYLGYSLGESTALLASRAWRGRDELFRRTLASSLFRTDLAGPMSVLRRAWGADADWKVVVVNRPAEAVRAALEGNVALLIVNAPRECVVGGTIADVDRVVETLGCHALELASVPTVHLPLVEAVRQAYVELHLLPTTPPPCGARIYSGVWGRAYEPDEAKAAASITEGALRGFDFPAVVRQAYDDGVRVFLELGPRSSCSRMIDRILGDRPHLSLSACKRGQDGFASLLTAVARVAEMGVPVDLDGLYGSVRPGGAVSRTAWLPPIVLGGDRGPVPPPPSPASHAGTDPVRPLAPPSPRPPPSSPVTSLLAVTQAAAAAHEAYLRSAEEGQRLFAQLCLARSRTVSTLDGGGLRPEPPPRFDRPACLEFAVGKISRVLGPAFAEVDGFPTRVRLPDEPLMLVDRIVRVEGLMGTPGPGRVVTEHDVSTGAWYLDGGRAPVCISVEAGQADLFLSAYLGIDLQTRGLRMYRLLDAKVTFWRDLPMPGESIRYDIRIDRFIRQGDTWLFFFRFDGTIDGRPFITMSDGCAGFFSPEDLDVGRGIVPRAIPAQPIAHPERSKVEAYAPLLPPFRGSLPDEAVEALRRGDLEGAFGDAFRGKVLPPALRLPSGRMRLVHRIVEFHTQGGRAGLGEVVGEADVTPDEWYLTCHFIDDRVMPGTLMYECCLHTLRVLLLRMGWLTRDASIDVHVGPVPEVASELRCRGQVTPETRKVRYKVVIEEIGYDPAPYVIATASMFADDRHVVEMRGMSARLCGLTRGAVEAEWRVEGPAFDRAHIVAFCEGNPSECFGDRYRPFDSDRRLARLPRDPYLFVDRVLSADAPPWVVRSGAGVVCEVDVPPDGWFFAASRQRSMPFAVLLEIALQPCGFLAAYLGTALGSDEGLHFRNLDGKATQLAEVRPGAGTLTMRARLTKVSQAVGMILQEFDIEISQGQAQVYVGQTGFGFFPSSALAAQVGIRGAAPWHTGEGAKCELERARPLTPEDARGPCEERGLMFPAAALSMIDRLLLLDLAGGPAGLGFVVGGKRVDPAEWFFRAHFYQDPVMPGSLGLEALVELLKVLAKARFPELARTHRFQALALGTTHSWQYRGQVVPGNREVQVEARVTSLTAGEEPTIVADGQLSVDGKVIYGMQGFALRLVREEVDG